MIDFSTFEAFKGAKPYLLLDQHPDGTYLAMQVEDMADIAAAIWSTETKGLVWPPEGACALSWLQGGTQLAALQYPISVDEYYFALYSWPQGQLLQECSVRFPFGYAFDLVVSPTNDLAICQWIDQSEFGFEFLTLSNDSIVPLSQQGYIKRGTNHITRPVFQPEGYLWVCAYQDNLDWWMDDVVFRQSHTFVAKEGKREQLGALMVFRQTQLLGEIPLIVTVPAGYHPPSVLAPGFFSEETKMLVPSEEKWGHLSDPVFLDAYHVMIRFPSGESQIHDLSEFGS